MPRGVALLLLAALAAVTGQTLNPLIDGKQYYFSPLADPAGVTHTFDLVNDPDYKIVYSFFADNVVCPGVTGKVSFCYSKKDNSAGIPLLQLSAINGSREEWKGKAESVELQYEHTSQMKFQLVFQCSALSEAVFDEDLSNIDDGAPVNQQVHTLFFWSKYACANVPTPIQVPICGSVTYLSTLMLACPAGQAINQILYAGFGTQNGVITGSCNQSISDGNCVSSNAVGYVARMCIGQQTCSVTAISTPGGFNPPVCGNPYTGQYTLTVKAMCVTKPMSSCSEAYSGFVRLNTIGGPYTRMRAMVPAVYGYDFDQHTVCVRVRFNTAYGNYRTIARTSYCRLYYGLGSLRYYCSRVGYHQYVVVNNVIQMGIWHAICVSRHYNGDMSIYVDGKPMLKKTAAHFGGAAKWAGTNGKELYPTTLHYLGENFKNDDIDEYRVFFKVLTDEQVRLISANSWLGHDDLFINEPSLKAYFPMSSFDLRNMMDKSSVLEKFIYRGSIVGKADLFCHEPCVYNKDKDQVVDPPTLITTASRLPGNVPYPDGYVTGFDGTTFNIRIRVHKRYFYNPLLATPWKATFYDNTNVATCSFGYANTPSKWLLKFFPTGMDDCYAVLEYSTTDYNDLTSNCGFQTTASGSKSLGGAVSDSTTGETGVYGQVRLDFQEQIPLSCQSKHMDDPGHPECQQSTQTLRTTLWRINFVTFFKTRVTKTNDQPLVIYDQASAVSVVVDQSVITGTLKLDKPQPYYNDLGMDAVFRTFVNWPYYLVLGTRVPQDQLMTPKGPWQIQPFTIHQISESATCKTPPAVQGTPQTCVQDWQISIKPKSSYLGPGKPILSNLDTQVKVTFTVKSNNSVTPDYRLRQITMQLTSGPLRPSTTERLDLDVEFKSCKAAMSAPAFTCDTSIGPANAFVTSAVSSYGTATMQRAYFAVIPTPKDSKSSIDWCQLLSVSAYPYGEPNSPQRFTAFTRKNPPGVTNEFGLHTDPLGTGAASSLENWISSPARMFGSKTDTTKACLFVLPIMRQYFSANIGASKKWTVEAMIYVKWHGVEVIPQTQQRAVLASTSEVSLSAAADTSGMSNGTGKTSSRLDLSIDPAVEAPVDVITKTVTVVKETSTAGASITITETKSSETVPIAAGCAVGGVFLGVVVGYFMMKACMGWKSPSRPPNTGSARMVQLESQMDRQMNPHPTSSGAAVPEPVYPASESGGTGTGALQPPAAL